MALSSKEIQRLRYKISRKYKVGFLDDKKCEICGSPEKLKKHHPEGLEKWDTIQILCARCHSLIHAPGRARKSKNIFAVPI
jgi:hypothetical protein